jgi:hypothetical protein
MCGDGWDMAKLLPSSTYSKDEDDCQPTQGESSVTASGWNIGGSGFGQAPAADSARCERAGAGGTWGHARRETARADKKPRVTNDDSRRMSGKIDM